VRTIRLVEYTLNRKKPRVVLDRTEVRYESNGEWMTVVIRAGEYTEENFLHELECQMGPSVFRVARDERSGNVFIRRIDGRKFRIDSVNNILNRLGFNSMQREEATVFIAEGPSTFGSIEWFLYVEDQNMGALDNRSDPLPLQLAEAEDIEMLKIQIRDREAKLVDVNGSAHTLVFELDSE